MQMLSFRKFHHEFLDEGGDIVVGNDFAFPFPDAECGFRYDNLQVFLYLYLTSEPPVVEDLFPAEEAHFRREDCAASFKDAAFALSAAALSSAG